MGKPTGFLEFDRSKVKERDPKTRIKDFSEFLVPLEEQERRSQGARCMDCGVPFCQSDYGCPVDNLIPEWNDLVWKGKDYEAFLRLMKTNNFPEFTGRVCPAPCETSCVLGINAPPVTIKDNECWIIDNAYRKGWMRPQPPSTRTGKKVVVVGSGPSGLAAADQLNKLGHSVTVLEREDRIGGLLTYGIPNMKLDKALVQRRVDIMAAEGIEFQTGVWVGKNKSLLELEKEYDAILLAIGSTRPRDLDIPNRHLSGIHFAMEFLTGNTKALLRDGHTDNAPIHAAGKKVIVIGGGDTGNDCLGTSLRHGCLTLKNFEVLPRPPEERNEDFPWPTYPRLYKVDYGHAEARARFGVDPREFSISTKEFIGNSEGRLIGLRTIRLDWYKEGGSWKSREIPGSEETWECDLVFLALGFLGPETELLSEAGLALDPRTNIQAAYGKHKTSRPKFFAAGDARRGQSLVVWAIKEGRLAAREVDRYLREQVW